MTQHPQYFAVKHSKDSSLAEKKTSFSLQSLVAFYSRSFRIPQLNKHPFSIYLVRLLQYLMFQWQNTSTEPSHLAIYFLIRQHFKEGNNRAYLQRNVSRTSASSLNNGIMTAWSMLGILLISKSSVVRFIGLAYLLT